MVVFAIYSEMYERKVNWFPWVNNVNQFIRIEVIINEEKPRGPQLESGKILENKRGGNCRNCKNCNFSPGDF